MKKIGLLLLALLGMQANIQALTFEEDQSIDLEILREAWQIPGGGGGNRPYYEIDIYGEKFLGERKWNRRWDLIENAIDYEGKRVLDLGCNITLIPIFLKKYKGALSCTGVDCPDNKLAKKGTPDLIRAAKLTQQAFGVDIPIIQANLDFPYEHLVGYDYDVVFCMSLYYWVRDKVRLMKFLSHFDHVIFEGHRNDPLNRMVQRFKKYGFDQYEVLGTTQVGVSHKPKVKRTIVHFYKTK